MKQESMLGAKDLKQPGPTFWGGLIAAFFSGIAGGGAALAASCCAGPAVLMAAGLGAGGASFFEGLAPYRLLFSIASVLMLLGAFWALYFRKQKNCNTNCSAGGSKASKIVFWITVGIVSALIVIPPALDALMVR